MNTPAHRLLSSRLVAAAAFLAVACSAAAQTLTWGAAGAGGAGTWSTSVANWSNGAGPVPWTNGDAALFAGTAGNVSISGTVAASLVTFSTAGYLLQNGFLYGGAGGLTVQTDADATIFSPIFGASPFNTTFSKTGAGMLLVNGSGAPIFFGSINVAAGELRYGNTTNPSASTAYVLGNTSGAALTFSSSLAGVGSLSGGGANGGVVRPTATSGNVSFTMNGVGDATYAGAFQSNNATLSLQKTGSGTQVLTGFSYVPGSVTVNGGMLSLAGAGGTLSGVAALNLGKGGTFQLDNAAVINQGRLDSSVPVNLNGGTFNFLGNSASNDVHQTIGALNVLTGASGVSVASAGAGVSQLIFSNKAARAAGATVGFTGGGQITLTGLSNVNGILGGYATVGADWASVDAGGNVSAYTGYATSLASAGAQDNLHLSTASTFFAQAKTQSFNSLNLVNTGSSSASFSIGSGETVTLVSGGLLASGSAGSRVDGGSLTAANGEMIITNQAALTVSSTIADNGKTAVTLTKSGAGTLALTALKNSYTGPTYINQGTVQASADLNLGAGNAVILNGGTLQATAPFSSTKALQGSGGTVDTAGNDVTFDSGGSTASFTKTGAGTLTVTRQNGAVTVNGGALRLSTLVGGNSTAVTVTNGRLEAGDNGLQSVTTLAGGGTLELSPGPIGQADTLTVNYLSIYSPTVVDFDLGSPSRNDLLSVSYNLTLSGASGSQLLFRFNNIGSIQTGGTYQLAVLPSSQLGQFSASSFGIDPSSTAAGYQGTISLTNGRVNIVFSAVPEPGVAGWLSLGATLMAGWRVRRRVVSAS